jgi:hypothetical protein
MEFLRLGSFQVDLKEQAKAALAALKRHLDPLMIVPTSHGSIFGEYRA